MLHRKRTQTGMSVRTDSLERDASVQQVHLSITLHSNIHVHSLVYSHIYRLLHLDHPLMDHCLLDGHFHVLDLQHKPEAPIVGTETRSVTSFCGPGRGDGNEAAEQREVGTGSQRGVAP